MIRRNCTRWGDLSMLEMCYKSSHVRAFEHPLIQQVQKKLWFGRIDFNETGYWSYLISLIPVIGWIFMPILGRLGWLRFLSNRAYSNKKGTVFSIIYAQLYIFHQLCIFHI